MKEFQDPQARDSIEGAFEMAWLIIISSVIVIWIASLFKILHDSYSPSKGAFLNDSTNGGSAKKRNVLLVVSYPDDESMSPEWKRRSNVIPRNPFSPVQLLSFDVLREKIFIGGRIGNLIRRILLYHVKILYRIYAGSSLQQ